MMEQSEKITKDKTWRLRSNSPSKERSPWKDPYKSTIASNQEESNPFENFF
jgi:hypothetical protein